MADGISFVIVGFDQAEMDRAVQAGMDAGRRELQASLNEVVVNARRSWPSDTGRSLNSLVATVARAGSQLTPRVGATASYATDIHGGTVVVELIERPVKDGLDATGERLADAYARGSNRG